MIQNNLLRAAIIIFAFMVKLLENTIPSTHKHFAGKKALRRTSDIYVDISIDTHNCA